LPNFVVATVKHWNERAFARHSSDLPGSWTLIRDDGELTIETLDALQPRYIFFPHWSWIVPDAILQRWECVCFHMTDVPFGRGGSPLQNLIGRGHKETKLTALRMTSELDAGPVYLKLPLSLEGRAQDIFERTADLVYTAVRQIVRDQPAPKPQSGAVTHFKRRTPEQSAFPNEATMSQLYDHIRMLDADTYPPAFLDHGPFRLELGNARPDGDDIVAEVRIRIGPNSSQTNR
jgi:methionyl-tRNA formyltransferase